MQSDVAHESMIQHTTVSYLRNPLLNNYQMEGSSIELVDQTQGMGEEFTGNGQFF